MIAQGRDAMEVGLYFRSQLPLPPSQTQHRPTSGTNTSVFEAMKV